MSDRALWAAFQKVRTEVEGALEETRKKEAQRIEAEEKRRREEKAKKRAAQPAAQSAAPSARLVRNEAPKAPTAGKVREAQGPSAPAPRTGRPTPAACYVQLMRRSSSTRSSSMRRLSMMKDCLS